jgi:hypothetical protein
MNLRPSLAALVTLGLLACQPRPEQSLAEAPSLTEPSAPAPVHDAGADRELVPDAHAQDAHDPSSFGGGAVLTTRCDPRRVEITYERVVIEPRTSRAETEGLLRTIRAQRGGHGACGLNELRAGATLPEAATLRLTQRPDSRVSDVTLEGLAQTPLFEACLRTAIQRQIVPAPRDGVARNVRIELRFRVE